MPRCRYAASGVGNDRSQWVSVRVDGAPVRRFTRPKRYVLGIDIPLMRRSVAVVGLVSFVLLAGCAGGFGFDTNTDAAPTLTPAPVPTDDLLSDLPPGLSEDGITDSFALADTHAEALTNTSFTVRRNRTLVAANGTRLVDRSSVQRVDDTQRRSTVERTFDGTVVQFFRGPVERVESWFNGTLWIQRRQRTNETKYRMLPPLGAADLTARQQLVSYYVEGESTAVTTTNGRIRLRANLRPRIANSPTTPAVNVTERTVVLTLTETGRVERYRAEYTGRLVNDLDTTVEGTRIVRFTGLGETNVERPDWIAAARNATADGDDGAATSGTVTDLHGEARL